jgi:hypothetical protein
MIVPIILRQRFRYILLKGEQTEAVVDRCVPTKNTKRSSKKGSEIKWLTILFHILLVLNNGWFIGSEKRKKTWAIIALQHSKLRLVHEVILFTVARHLILSGLKAEQIRSEMLPWRHADSNQNQPVHWESAPNCTDSPFPLRKT